MTTSFVPSIISLRKADPNQLLSELGKMFGDITKMTADEVVAAYQTTCTAARVAGITSDDPMLYGLFQALIAQMVFIASKERKQVLRFEQVTGNSYLFKDWRFLQASY